MSQQPDHQDPVAEYTKVESIFVRHRNCLLLKADFSPIFTDYYLHLMEHKLRHKPELDSALKDLLAALTLHLVARPWAETIAWTATLRAPRVNFFATGSSVKEQITGTLFTKDVKESDRSLLFSQTVHPETESRKSMIEIDSTDPLKWIENYYTHSEQRPGRAFRLKDDQYALVAAQPDFDEEWFNSLTVEQVDAISEDQETKLLETRKFYFSCGCSEEKLLGSLAGYRDDPDALFGDEDEIHATCPRCSAKYTFTRDIFARFDEAEKNSKNESS